MSLSIDLEVVPQAIIWRPIHWFTRRVRQEEDDLDRYKAIAYIVGNDLSFEVRNYQGDEPNTSTLYLPFEHAHEDQLVQREIGSATRRLSVPINAVAWRRGDPFEPGKIERPPQDRIREAEARDLALKIAASQPNRTATTEFIKNAVPDLVELSPADLIPSGARNGEPLWRQIVGNVISHKNSRAGPFVKGLAVRTANGLRVTQTGVDYLKSIGFSD
ncbi:MAG: hypothetical protein JWO81_750 [Alphaproteobacteria bacterium]|nr:hypothetical protein [Alphaproteobacteria bacterium]